MSMRRGRRQALGLAVVASAALVVAACGEESSGDAGYGPESATNANAEGARVELMPLNGSGVTARALVVKGEDTVTVSMTAEGLEPGATHPQNIHRYPDERPITCPDASAEIGLDELQAAAGPIALELLPTPEATAEGTASFSETFPLEAAKIYNGAIVISGAVVDGAFDPSVPVACGQLGV